MNPEPLFTVITVVLNGEKTIERAVKSLQSQSCKDFEYVVVDGGSTDRTVDILKSYGNLVNKLVIREGRGVSDAFNTGIENANGKILYFLNADDWLENDSLEIIRQRMARQESRKVIFCGATRFHTVKETSFIASARPEILLRETSVHHSSAFICKGVFGAIGVFDTSYAYAMDYEFFIRARFSEVEFQVVDAVLANRSLDGLSYRNYRASLRETKRAREAYVSAIKNNYYYYIALLKEYLAQFIRNQRSLSGLYRYYWKVRNR